MLRILSVSLVGLSLVLAAAGCQPDAPATIEIRRTIALTPETLRIDLPRRATLTETPGGVVIDFRPGGRRPQRIALRWIRDADLSLALDRRADLGDGWRLDHRFIPHRGPVGSGGEEVALEGLIRPAVNSRLIHVRCELQREAATARDAEWCLRYLHSLRRADP